MIIIHILQLLYRMLYIIFFNKTIYLFFIIYFIFLRFFFYNFMSFNRLLYGYCLFKFLSDISMRFNY